MGLFLISLELFITLIAVCQSTAAMPWRKDKAITCCLGAALILAINVVIA